MFSDEFLKGLGLVIGSAILVVAKPLYDVLKKKRYVLWNNAKLKSQKEIMEIINDMRSRLRVDRVAIFEYCNGEKTLSGVPFIFGCMSFESKAHFIESIKEQYKKFPTSWFASILGPMCVKDIKSALWVNHGYYLNRDSTFINEENAGVILDGANIKASLLVKFTENVGDGILAISNHTSEIEITDRDYEIIVADALKIWYLLKMKR